MSDDIKELHYFSDTGKVVFINKAKDQIAQLPNLKECALDYHVDSGYLYLNKVDEQSNVYQWARIALGGYGKDCVLMLYDGVWSDSFTGSFGKCLRELDSKLVLSEDMNESVELPDGEEGDVHTVCNTEEVQSEQDSEETTDMSDSFLVETEDVDSEIITTPDNTKDEPAPKIPLKLSLDEEQKAISDLKLGTEPFLDSRCGYVLVPNTRDNYICIDKLDGQNNANQWARIAIYNDDRSDCDLILYDGTWKTSFSGSYVECIDCLRIEVVNGFNTQEQETHMFDKKETKQIPDIIEKIIAGEKVRERDMPFPVLKTVNLQIKVIKEQIFLNLIDEQKKSVRWAKIAIDDRKGRECALLVFSTKDKKWKEYAKGSWLKCLSEAERAYIEKYGSKTSTILTDQDNLVSSTANDVEKHLEEGGESPQAEVTVPNEEVS